MEAKGRDNLLPDAFVERSFMDNNQYNEQRHNRKKQWYHFTLGLQQLKIYPLINLIWLLLVLGVKFLVVGERKLVSRLHVAPVLEMVFNKCMQFIVILFPVICAIGIIQLIGYITAIKDEADLSIVFGDEIDVKNQPPILVHKKTDKKNGVTKREFYTTIPMERWQKKQEAICDRLNIHVIGEITYGGRNRNIGNRVIIQSAKGRKPIERGVLYDDTF